AAGFLDGGDHLAAARHVYRSVRVAVEGPARQVFDLLSLLGIAATANWDDRGPLFRRRHGVAPCSHSPHRQAGQVDSFRIDRVALLDVFEDRQRQLAAGRTSPPSKTWCLRNDGQKGKRLLTLRDRWPDAYLDRHPGLTFGLGSFLGFGLPRAMQEQNG